MTLRLLTLIFLLGSVYLTNVAAQGPKTCQLQHEWCNGLSKKCCSGVECYYLKDRASGELFGKCVRTQWDSPPPSEEEMRRYAALPDIVAPHDPRTGASLGDGADGDEYDEDDEDDDHFDYEGDAAQQLQAQPFPPAQPLQAQPFPPAQQLQAQPFLPAQPLQAPPVPQYRQFRPVMDAHQLQQLRALQAAQRFRQVPIQQQNRRFY